MEQNKDAVGAEKNLIRRFLFPKFDLHFLFRLLTVAVLTWILFAFVVEFSFISGDSMYPTYADGEIILCNRLKFLLSPPERGDVVTVSFFGRKKLLKRIIALPGDSVEFRNGKLFVNGEMIDEEYVKQPCVWDIPPVVVRDGYFYIVGDNRSQDKRRHVFGEVEARRIKGGPFL